ncbi:hypothetical protein COU59_01150 [Candidatus Pacearchaeota archaeon CG10_big_fil_rev_8_21_14_0_10_34_12]|nr:MAG: hypothetical protein COU59_01150 [Candidatus Pacearchaeota archaeon CG10_big_fil_rev_8_21_14_0_10_34_12]
MKKRTSVFIVLLAFAVFPLMFAQAANETCSAGDDSCKIDNGYSCLNQKINDKECDNLAPEEKVFSLIAAGKCLSEVKDDSQFEDDIIYTSQSVIGMKESGSVDSDTKKWLFGQNRTSEGIDWFLEVESPNKTSCTIESSGTNTVSINEDKTIGSVIGGSSCLTKSSNGYWLEINPNCYDENFTISCDNQFLTTLLYKSSDSDTIYVSEKTSSASAEGETEEKVESLCFGDGSCNYEETLWGALALNVLGINTDAYLPYLITKSSDSENENFLPNSFLYHLTGSVEFKNQLLAEQINGKWWTSKESKYFGTALALYPLQYEEPSQKKDSVDWLLNEVQEEDGCWNSGNIRDTAFILYSLSPKSFASTGTSCQSAGYFCLSQINCNGEILQGYSCSGAFVCCTVDKEIQTCSQQGGEICSSNQICSGVGSITTASSDISSGELCCVNGVCQVPQAPVVSECESQGGECRVNSCLSGESESSLACQYSGDVCCISQTKSSSTGWVWVFLLLILIGAVVAGIIYRDKLIPYWMMIKSKFRRGGNGLTGSSAPSPGPRSPPSSPGFRRPMPSRHPARRLPGARSQGEIDEVLKKLKEMGK